MDKLYIVTNDGYRILYEEKEDFLQDEKYILINDMLIRKENIDEPSIFKATLCVITFDYNKIKTYQTMLEKMLFRRI